MVLFLVGQHYFLLYSLVEVKEWNCRVLISYGM